MTVPSLTVVAPDEPVGRMIDDGFVGQKCWNIHHARLNFHPRDCIWFLTGTYLTIETRVLNNEVRVT